MTNPIDLSMRAAGLWLRAASLGIKAATVPLEVTARAAGSLAERATEPARPVPIPVAPDVPDVPDAVVVSEPPKPIARKPAARRGTTAAKATTASPKQRRRTTRGKPTRGQAARRRGAQRTTETAAAQQTDAAPHVGAEIQVVEPWEGYAAMPAADVVGRLADADDTTRAAVRLYESAHEGREAVLHATEAQ
jgi:hypothetical protein